MKRRIRASDYTVGWICAIPIVLAAAQEIPDETHEAHSKKGNDPNDYTLGRIGEHNVVLACLQAGQAGTYSAGILAARMTFQFSSIRFSLLVGVGGGVPTPELDIRLGDVVVSQPYLQYGAVVQHNSGKRVAGGHKIRTGSLIAPPSILLHAVSELRALHYRGKSNLAKHLSSFERLENFSRHTAGPDILFDAAYEHVKGEATSSGDTLIKDGITRDEISAELGGGVLCFEMEAAGLMNNFPCLVIRGISNYADTHKNKMWQPYAAATAVAYGKEILSVIPASKEAIAASVDSSIFLNLSKRAECDLGHVDPYNIFEHISDYDPDRKHRNYLRSRCQGTTNWILDHKEFISWYNNESSSCLWLTVGCGKTILTSTALEWILQESEKTNDFVAHFFYDHSNKSQLRPTHLFRSYIKQILGHLEITGKTCSTRIISSIKRFFGPRVLSPSFDEILDEIFFPLHEELPSATYIVDEPDECDTKEVQKVLRTFQKMMSQYRIKVFISGLEGLDVTKYIRDSSTIRISNGDVKEDIHRFIELRIEEKMKERTLTENEFVLRDIQNKLNERADGMILWVKLQLETLWEDCFTDAEIQVAPMNLPKDLSETYERCLAKIGATNVHFSSRILRWVCATIKPFKVEQLREALAININTGTLDRHHIPSADVLKCCSDLIIQDTDSQVLLAHHSIRQFLLDTTDIQLFADGIDLDRTRLELGELCISHLSSFDYSLVFQSFRIDKDPDFDMKLAIEKRGEIIPSFLRSASLEQKSMSVQISLSRKFSRVPIELSSFFHYAREQWAPLTRTIAKTSKYWDKFSKLALKQNLSWKLHPWPALGESLDSHYSGMLGWSIVNRHLPLLDLLLGLKNPRPKADIFNIPFHHYEDLPALHLASRTGDFEILDDCFQKADIKARDNAGRTDLLLSAENGHYELVYLLLKYGAEVDPVDNTGKTALMLAAGRGHEMVVEVLLDNGADFTAIDYNKWTALFSAAHNLHEKIVRILIQEGADSSAKDDNGQTALDIAVKQISLKLSSPLDSDSELVSKKTTLLTAVDQENIAMVQLLFDLGIGKDSEGWTLSSTALIRATVNGYGEMVRLLLRYSVNVNGKGPRGRTALIEAAQGGHKEIVQLLLKNGVDTTAQDEYRQTAFMCAVKGDHIEVARLLLEYDAAS